MVDNLKDQEYIDSHYVVLVTRDGTVKKTSLEAYSRPRTQRDQCDQCARRATRCSKRV